MHAHTLTRMCVLLAHAGSWDVMEWCREAGVLYVDTVAEPWLGGYTDPALPQAARTNFAMREKVLRLRDSQQPGAPTAISCHGANPGMVSHFVKQALLNIARDTGHATEIPATREGWAALARALDVRAIHIAERDFQVRRVLFMHTTAVVSRAYRKVRANRCHTDASSLTPTCRPARTAGSWVSLSTRGR
jgi:homospermidine synthase